MSQQSVEGKKNNLVELDMSYSEIMKSFHWFGKG